MLRIGICDDVMSICHNIEKILTAYAEENNIDVDIEVFYDGETLCEFLLNEASLDLIYLDIELKMLSGLDVAMKIRRDLGDIDTEIAFVSGTTQYDRQLFDVQPLSFIEKPIDPEQVIKVLELTIRRRNCTEKYFSFKIDKNTIHLRYNEILYVESFNRKLTLYCHSCSYTYYDKLQRIASVLPRYFCRIHKSYIINTHHIREIHSNKVVLVNNVELPIGSSFKKQFAELMQTEMLEED